MIDVENMVINEVHKALATDYPDVVIYGEYVDAPSSFPCVTVVEDGNSTYSESCDTSIAENHAEVYYTINVYSNKADGNKAECKEIANKIDDELQKLKFTRTMKSVVPNVDRTIYRIAMRYKAVVSKPITVGNNTVYQIYRR